ncbi:MAG: tetratricopeptide repeat protein [Acidobacteriota bacterium]
MRFSPVFLGMLLLLPACVDRSVAPDHASEWREVLHHKKAAATPNATPQHKQRYADSVRSFIDKHPEHSRAREVWHRLQLEFADDLAAAGRHQDAIRFYRAVLAEEPANAHARHGLATAVERLAVSRDKLLTLEKGMSHRQVSSILGKPMPGWTTTNKRPEAEFEAWYYRTRGGGVAGVYFRDGKVFAAEETSNAKLGRLGS